VSRHKVYDRIYPTLFNPEKAKGLTEIDKEIKERWETIFAKWLEDPSMSTQEMVKFVISKFGIKGTQAYIDISNAQLLLGNVSNAKKEWQRYTAITMVKEGYALVNNAKSSLDVKMGLAKIKAGEVLGKITKLDKEEGEPIPYDDIVPQQFEPTGDVSVLGIKPIDNLAEKQERMRRKFGVTSIEEAKLVDE